MKPDKLPKPIGVGIVGASAQRGWARVAHIPALQALEAFEIRGVSTTRMASARATANMLGINLAFDNHRALVTHPDIDLVVVAVKVPEHHAIVSDALAAGKMVYCEWPLGRDLAEAVELATLAREKQLKTVVGLQGRLHPPIRYARDLVRQGAIGKPLSTSIRAYPTEPMWRGLFDPPFEFMADSSHGATMLSIVLGHALEPLASVLGNFESLSAVTANRRGDGVRLEDGASISKNAPDEIAVLGLLQDGVVASVHVSAGIPPGSAMTWEIQGSEGSLLVESKSAAYLQMGELEITLRRANQSRRMVTPPAYLNDHHGLSGVAAGIARMYAQLASDLAEGASLVPDFETAVARHRVLDAINAGAASGQRQLLKDHQA
jgi:predicted dehydrogenase